MKIYISGPITGQPDGNREAFASAEAILSQLGHTAINPHKLCEHLPDGSAWEEYMKLCIPVVCQSDAMYMLPGWNNSRGAVVEKGIADILSLPSYYPGERIPLDE